MIRTELLDRVKYPGETDMTFDCIAYDDLEEGLMAETQYPPGEIRDSAIDTLAELRRRYAERQERKE